MWLNITRSNVWWCHMCTILGHKIHKFIKGYSWKFNCENAGFVTSWKFTIFKYTICIYHIAGKFGREKLWWICSFWKLGRKKFGEWIDQPIGYQLYLDGFSWANHGRFVKFAKLSPRQTFLLYGIHLLLMRVIFQILVEFYEYYYSTTQWSIHQSS